jgi:hypothetical protein
MTLGGKLQGHWLYAAQAAMRRLISSVGHRALVKRRLDCLLLVEFAVEGHTEIVELLKKQGAKE